MVVVVVVVSASLGARGRKRLQPRVREGSRVVVGESHSPRAN